MSTSRTGLWSLPGVILSLALAVGCGANGSDSPTLPGESSAPPVTPRDTVTEPALPSEYHHIWAMGFLVIDEDTLSCEVLPDRTSESHWDVTWVKDICPTCVVAHIYHFDPDTRTFYIELKTKNPTKKIGHDVRFIIDLDGSGKYYMIDPDNYTKLHDPENNPNPFRAIAREKPSRSFWPAENRVSHFALYIAEDYVPVPGCYIPFIIDASYPGRCQEPYEITDITVEGEFPPGGGGEVTVELVSWDTQDDHGEVWLRTGGIFTPSDVLMTPGVDVEEYGKKYSATFTNSVGGGAGLVNILIEAYTSDTGVEPYPLNDFAKIWADPGGESAIAGDVFNALNVLPANGATITIHSTSGGTDPLPYNVTDGTYYVPVLPGTYTVDALHSFYFRQDTIVAGWNDVTVPPDTTVLVCFGLAPKYLDDPGQGIATISGVIRDSTPGDPIPGAQATLDGGPELGGIIQARTADERGHYCFYAVPTEQQNNWTVHAFHEAYLPDKWENVPSAKNKSTPQVDFDLQPTTQEAVWAENFEPGTSNIGTQQDWFLDRVVSEPWPDSGWPDYIPDPGSATYHDQHEPGDILWRVWDPISNPIQCDYFFIDNGPPSHELLCILPPDDTSDGYIPDPYEGHRYFWYGEEIDETPGGSFTHHGSFIDEWNGDLMLGGTSSNPWNAGIATSGPIDLGGYSELTLTLQSWFEIEGVDPSIQYDAMDVLISTDQVWWDRLERLNPLAEPIPDLNHGNAQHPYTSSGFDQAAIWSPSVIDISDWGGEVVWLRLDFDTRDPLYNGFRSWFVDDMKIWPYAIE